MIRMVNRNAKLIYPELSYTINGMLFKVHNALGRFCRERQYANAIEDELRRLNMPCQREVAITADNRADFVIEEKVLLEIKAKPFITKEDYYQTLRYIQAKNLKLALLVNFRNRYLRPKRILN